MSNQETKKERKPFVINVDEPVAFNAIAETKFITSNDLCQMVSELFRNIFADFEGCIFEYDNNFGPSLALVFNHGKYDEDAILACERASGKTVGSTVIDRTRTRDYFTREGDRYQLTEDGRDAVKSLLINRMYNNGSPNFKSIVSEYVDRNAANMWNQGNLPQYTKVSYIDIRKVCCLIFGDKDDNNVPVDYEILVRSSMNQNSMYGGIPAYQNYMLNIIRASLAETQKIYEKIGLGSGTAIVR